MVVSEKFIMDTAKRLRLSVSAWAPGDRYGTRYQFFGFADRNGALYRDYGTYCGRASAWDFLRGFMAGMGHRKARREDLAMERRKAAEK